MKAGPKGEAGGRKLRTVEVLPGPDPWCKQRMGLARVAIGGRDPSVAAGSSALRALSEESGLGVFVGWGAEPVDNLSDSWRGIRAILEGRESLIQVRGRAVKA